MKTYFKRLKALIPAATRDPKGMIRQVGRVPHVLRGSAHRWAETPVLRERIDVSNPLREYFDAHLSGPGIWKWEHYFDIYHRHFESFRGTDVRVAEIGIYSGGSLGLWHHYFGDRAKIIGVDIEPACKVYANDWTDIYIGDQSDRAFWHMFKQQEKPFDILIDDGGHEPEQQIVTFEEMFGHLRPGGVYLCEDVHGVHNEFLDYVYGFSKNLHGITDDQAVSRTNDIQAWVKCISIYPYVVVIEKRTARLDFLTAPKHGTEWQPFSMRKDISK